MDRLEEGSGIWIAPCEAIHTLGMKTPIDAIFIDHQLRVKKLRRQLADPGMPLKKRTDRSRRSTAICL